MTRQHIKKLLLYTFVGLLIYMPFHVFLSQSLSQLVGLMTVWKILKDVLVMTLFLLTTFYVFILKKQKLLKNYKLLLALIGVYGILHIVVFLMNHNTTPEVALLATVYNNRFLWLFMTGINLGIIFGKPPLKQTTILKLIIAVSTMVCLLGLLQWILPKDILVHFGYGIENGVKPNFFINDNPAYPRIFSTIRDPNSLGAFLIIPIMLLVQLLLKSKNKLFVAGLLTFHLLILFLTFSRASWGGLIIALAFLVVLNHKSQAKNILKKYWVILSCLLILMSVLTASISQTPTFRSIILKANDTNSEHELDSDELHVDFVKRGVKDIINKPLGDGPGTAGIVSIQNKNGGRLTENYYIQVALEVGVAGLILFLSIWFLVVRILFNQPQNTLTVALICTAIAYFVMAFVMHLWANEVVAYTWWGLAGLVIYTSTAKQKTILLKK